MKKFKPLDQKGPISADALNHTSKVQNIIESKGRILEGLKEFASAVSDFRRTDKGNIRHRLEDIILLMVFARASKCVGRTDIIEFGRHNLNKLRKIGILKNGVPSEATLCRIENGINERDMACRMQEFAQKYHSKLLDGCGIREIICIDGKAERGTVQDNGRNPDIVSAYSFDTGIILATEACREKSNEITAVPLLLDKIELSGKIVTADAMALQKNIIDMIRGRGGDFLIELKANQRSLRYGVEDSLKTTAPVYSYTIGPGLRHGRIETRTYRIYDGLGIIADKEKWGVNMTVVEYLADTVRKSTGEQTSEKRLYVSSIPTGTPLPGAYVRNHWSVESMHWGLDVNLLQDRIKRKYPKAARNLDTIQRLIFNDFYR